MRVAVYENGQLVTVLDAFDLDDARQSFEGRDVVVREVQANEIPPAQLPN